MSIKSSSIEFVDWIRLRVISRLALPPSVKRLRSAQQIDITLKMMLAASVLSIPLFTQFATGWDLAVVCCAGIACGLAVLLWQLHRGAVQFATAGLLILLTGIFLIAGLLAVETRGLNPAYFLVLVVVTASLLLSFRGLVTMIVICIVVILLLGVVLTTRLHNTPDEAIVQVGLVSAILLLLSTSAVVTFNSRNLHAALARADADQLALAVRNAELEQEIAERQRVETLANLRSQEMQRFLDASRMLSSTLELKPLLRAILTHLRSVAGFDAAMISEFVGANQYVLLASVPEDLDNGPTPVIRHIDAQRDIHLQAMIDQRKPTLIDDIQSNHPFATAQRARWMQLYGGVPAYVRSSLFLPLLVRDQIIGYISIYSATAAFNTPELVNLGMAFAAQIASAIAVVRSHEKSVTAASYSATMAERSRLARELHDSVSQALFGIVLGANTMLTSADTNRPVTRDSMVYVLQLAQAALSEMRALIFELRPESLHAEGLLSVLRKQAEALAARHLLIVTTHFAEEEPMLSLEAKEALYRIGLEAIQNVIKHAGAQRVELCLEQEQGWVRLKVQDDGKGFNPDDSFPDHFGLKTMAERAQIFGGSVRYISQPRQGTCVLVEMPIAP